MIEELKIFLKNIKWRKMNKHNYTVMRSLFPLENVVVGKETYGDLKIICYNPELHIKIGAYCSLANEVTFLMGGEHNYKCISTYPFFSRVYRKSETLNINKNNDKKDIIIEDDVWIGYGALIFPGVKIGKGSVIGARSIVLKDVPAYSVYVGTNIVSQRFPKEILDELEKIDFAEITHKSGDAYEKYCKTEININNFGEIYNTFVNEKR